ncbi:MAG: site-specific integrase [Rikenellaceae bacterium]|nr:site-specific integrase [Rikenellaceae bacterium]
MTSFRFYFRPPTGEGPAFGTLYVRIIHGRKYRDIRRSRCIYPHEWDAAASWLNLTGTDSPERLHRLREIEASMRADLHHLERIVKRLSVAGEYSVGNIADQFLKIDVTDTVLSFATTVARNLHHDGRVRTARAYRSAARSLIMFNDGHDMLLGEITSRKMHLYERWLLDRGLQMNTVSFYMRNLRAIYYRAVAAKIISPTEINPFESVYTGVYETRRRSLDRQDINALAGLEKKISAADTRLRSALLYFLFAYHARGMSFIDLAHLKKSDVKNGSIIYKRKKTGFYIEVKVTKPMKRIMDGFKSVTKTSPFVFPIIDPAAANHRLQYESALNRQNKALKELAGLAGIENSLSTHVARHTWATLAKRMGYNVSLISEGLGHRDTKVTSIYLASFERSALDELSVRMSKAVVAA